MPRVVVQIEGLNNRDFEFSSSIPVQESRSFSGEETGPVLKESVIHELEDLLESVKCALVVF